MTNLKDSLLNRGLELGMSTLQKVIGHPTLGPFLMRTMSQILQLKQSLEDARSRLLERMQLASLQEQDQLRRQIATLEKKLERLERRMREMQQKARETAPSASASEANPPKPTPSPAASAPSTEATPPNPTKHPAASNFTQASPSLDSEKSANPPTSGPK